MNNKMPLVTVGIAAYNVEKFLEEGMRSVFQQTYKNLEIILVDDGSTDTTPEICDRLAQEDQRISVIHKENGGLGSARNAAIDAAVGKYIWFFDVDDSAEPDLIADCVQYAEKDQLELVIFGFFVLEVKREEELICPHEQLIACNEDLKAAYENGDLFLKHGNGFAWNKFYSVDFLHKHSFRFGGQKIQEDEIFNMQLYPKLNRVYLCGGGYYHYVIYAKGNLSSKYSPDKSETLTEVYRAFMNLCCQWDLHDERVFHYIRQRYIHAMISTMIRNYYHPDAGLTKVERYRQIKRDLNRPEFIECVSRERIEPSKNPFNAAIDYAAYHRRTIMLMLFRNIKEFLRTLKGEVK